MPLLCAGILVCETTTSRMALANTSQASGPPSVWARELAIDAGPVVLTCSMSDHPCAAIALTASTFALVGTVKVADHVVVATGRKS